MLEPVKALERQGYEVTYLQPGRQGDITLEQVEAELKKRSEKQGNLKTFHQVDKNT